MRDKNKVLGALIQPGFLKKLGGSAQREVRRALLKELIPDDVDFSIDVLFLDRIFLEYFKASDR